MPEVTEFRVVLTVSDFDEAVSFYRDALGLEQLADWTGVTTTAASCSFQRAGRR
jgi:catechol 2,3-dioxygenase-like lactoylglutathione lyase family enzyme